MPDQVTQMRREIEEIPTAVERLLREGKATTREIARRAERLPLVQTKHWLTDPIPLIVSFYAMVEQVAARRGTNPVSPRHLKKVTGTL